MASGGNYFEEKNEEPNYAGLARWLVAIAATVLACYLAWYFTKPAAGGATCATAGGEHV